MTVKEENSNKEEGPENNKDDINLFGKIYKNKKTIILLALFLMGISVYIYYYYSGASIATLDSELKPKLNFVILGIYEEEFDNKQEIEPDSILHIELDTEKKELVLNAIPTVFEYNNQNLEEKNINFLLDNLEDIKGINHDYYFIINQQGFVKIIEQLGGIEIKLDEPMKIPELGLYLKRGTNLITGREALNYIRWYEYGDWESRIEREWQVISGIKDKIFQTNSLLDIPEIYSTLHEGLDAIETNLDRKLVMNIFEVLTERDNFKIKYNVIENDQ